MLASKRLQKVWKTFLTIYWLNLTNLLFQSMTLDILRISSVLHMKVCMPSECAVMPKETKPRNSNIIQTKQWISFNAKHNWAVIASNKTETKSILLPQLITDISCKNMWRLIGSPCCSVHVSIHKYNMHTTRTLAFVVLICSMNW